MTRSEFDPEPHLLPPGGARWIENLADDMTLSDATSAVQDTDPEFDPGPTLTLLLQGNAIVSLTTREDQR